MFWNTFFRSYVLIIGIMNIHFTNSVWQPSITEFKKFSPKSDVTILRKAMKGFGTDEAAIIKVLTSRNLAQRKILLSEFSNTYKRDLLKDLKSELGGNLEDLIGALFQDRYNFIASELKYAMKGIGTDETALDQLLCCRTTTDMQMVKSAYKSQYGEALENDIKKETSGDYRKLIMAFVTKPRGTSTDDDEAEKAANKLIQAGFSKMGTDENAFTQIFSGSSFPLLKKISAEYLKKTGRTLKDAVDSETTGDFRAGLMSVVDYAEGPLTFYINKLHSALDKPFPDKRATMRILILRSEIDLKAIGNAFLKRFNRSLNSFLSDKTSGDYRTALIGLLDGNV